MEKIYKAWDILLSNEKKIFIFLIFMKIIGMCLEVFGIALIIPLISVLLKKDTEFFNIDIFGFFDFLSYGNQFNLTTLIVVFIIFIYLIKNSYLMFLAWVDSKFAYGVSARLSKDLFKGYINLPYHFYLERNTSKLVYNTTTAVDLYKYALTHVTILFSELFVLIGLSTFLIFIEPFGFVCAALLISLVALMYYKMHKKKITEWGEKTQSHQKLRIKNLMQGFGAIKDIIILGLQDFFIKMYDTHNIATAEMTQKNHIINAYPKYILEVFGVLGILSLLLILKFKMNSVENIIIILGVFAAASFRLMPSAHRILNALQGFRFSIATVDNLSNELDLFTKQSVPTNNNTYVKNQQNYLSVIQKFHLLNVSYKYPNTEKDILKNISLTLNKGEMLGLFGKTGSGKSTIVDIITGLLNFDNGEIIIDQKKFNKVPIFWQRRIGYVPQNIYLLDESLKKNIALGVNVKKVDESKIEEVIDLLDLKTLVNTLPVGMETEIGERGTRLSGGEKQRIGIARALYNDPQILIFDEATNALDIKTEESIMSSIKKLLKEKIILIISHKKKTLSFCNRVVELKNGAIKESDA